MDIFQRIRIDHDHHRELVDKLAQTSGASPEREKLWQVFKLDLDAHADAEDQSLYAALLAKPESQEKARHSIAEHKELDELMATVADSEMSEGAWLQHFKKLEDRLKHHMAEEEREVFPLAKEVLSPSEALDLAVTFSARKKEEKSQAA